MTRGGTSRNDGKAAGPDNSNSKNSLPRVFQRSFRPPPLRFLCHPSAPPSFLRYNNRVRVRLPSRVPSGAPSVSPAASRTSSFRSTLSPTLPTSCNESGNIAEGANLLMDCTARDQSRRWCHNGVGTFHLKQYNKDRSQHGLRRDGNVSQEWWSELGITKDYNAQKCALVESCSYLAWTA